MDNENKSEIVTEKEFFDIWEKVCKKKNDELVDAWKTHSDKTFTQEILGKKNCKSVMHEIKNELKPKGELKPKDEWDIQQEYYSADVIFYKKKDCINVEMISPAISNTRSFDGVWLNKIRIHLEHENDVKTTWHEIYQLQTFASDLKVLVTYPRYKDDKEIQEILDAYKKIIEKDNIKLLVIFGFLEGKTIKWEGHKWDKTKSKFIDVNDQTGTP